MLCQCGCEFATGFGCSTRVVITSCVPFIESRLARKGQAKKLPILIYTRFHLVNYHFNTHQNPFGKLSILKYSRLHLENDYIITKNDNIHKTPLGKLLIIVYTRIHLENKNFNIIHLKNYQL